MKIFLLLTGLVIGLLLAVWAIEVYINHQPPVKVICPAWQKDLPPAGCQP